MSQFVGPAAVYDGVSQTSLTGVIPSYVFQEYADDDDIQALFEAQTDFAQGFLNWFIGANLPIYTGGIVAGPLLDWVGQGIYGIVRPSITTGSSSSIEATNQYWTDQIATNERKVTSSGTSSTVNDDIYRRVLTWNLYKGDGYYFDMEWLKRRIYRFLQGPNGIPPATYDISTVNATVASSVFTITASGSDPATGVILNSLIQSGACNTPFEMTFNLTATT
jgi:hypothetical protein